MSARNKKTALIAMSGGVDSSVAAWLMLREGYDCMGVTMRLFRNPDIGRSLARACCSQADIDDAAEVAFQLDIPHAVPDFTAEFRQQVMEKFVRDVSLETVVTCTFIFSLLVSVLFQSLFPRPLQ